MKYEDLLISDLAPIIISFLPIRFILLSYAVVSKNTLKVTSNYLLKKDDLVKDAKPLEESARLFCSILDTFRLVSHHVANNFLTPEAQEYLNMFQSIDFLRQPHLMNDLYKLNLGMYRYWSSSPRNINEGVYHAVTKYYQKSLEGKNRNPYENALVEDCIYWNSSRIFGDFTILFERPDGTILISENYQEVFLVLGQAQSLGEVANLARKSNGDWNKRSPYALPKLHSPIIGVKVSVTLLNWKNRILYDGLMQPIDTCSKKQLILALQSYLTHLENNTIIYSLPKKEIQGVHPLLIKPLSKDVIQSLILKHSQELNYLKQQYFHPKDSSHIWSFSRHGYSEEFNANHYLSVLDNLKSLVIPFATEALEPTISEYIHILCLAVEQHQYKPQSIIIDSETNYLLCKSILEQECDILVEYKPRPSDEELKFRGIVSNKPFCEYCGTTSTPNQKNLFRCARCKIIYYCCREHQKKDWKKHRSVCY